MIDKLKKIAELAPDVLRVYKGEETWWEAIAETQEARKFLRELICAE